MGEFDKALESYSFALNFAPLAVPILLDRAAIYMEMGKTDRAYTDYCQVLDEDKKNKEALLMRAYIFMWFAGIIRLHGSIITVCWRLLLRVIAVGSGLATLDQKEGKFREALEILNKMIVESPDDATLYIARADVEREMKHDDLALVDLEEAIRLDASSADAYLLRGNIYLAQKKKALAKRILRKQYLWECHLPICMGNFNSASDVILLFHELLNQLDEIFSVFPLFIFPDTADFSEFFNSGRT